MHRHLMPIPLRKSVPRRHLRPAIAILRSPNIALIIGRRRIKPPNQKQTPPGRNNLMPQACRKRTPGNCHRRPTHPIPRPPNLTPATAPPDNPQTPAMNDSPKPRPCRKRAPRNRHRSPILPIRRPPHIPQIRPILVNPPNHPQAPAKNDRLMPRPWRKPRRHRRP